MSKSLNARRTVWAYIQIARPDHWFKNVFALPGVMIVWVADPAVRSWHGVGPVLVALLALCLVASANYTINEYLDADRDREHPVKKNRPAARGEVSGRGVVLLWLVLSAIGLGLGFLANVYAGWGLAALWLMGIVYNVPPLRTKEVAYLDVLSEALNNPIRLIVGWLATGSLLVPPLSLLMAYWMLGAFFMGVKRFAEYRHLADPALAARYRSSFKYYDEERLLVSVIGYAAASAMFGGMFIVRYRIELVLAVPMIAILFAWYLHLGLKPESLTIAPERLYRDRTFALFGLTVFMICLTLLLLDVPLLTPLFAPSIDASGW